MSIKNTEYASVIDCTRPVTDLDAQIPCPARTYPFELDAFQSHAILHLEKHDNVFVAAHTSAGKTVVAEYAIAMSQRNETRVIYTSPIKALSNQKYRDFKKEFTDVGIITGDVQINSEATCLIMTTEILLKMLYNGNEMIHDLEWVIFDEVHYVNDPERGHVWEEVFIMLPEHVNLVLLSATVPNYVEFADWLGRTRNKITYVVSTYTRPVPLEHFLYTGSNGKTIDERFLIINKNGEFNIKGYREADERKKERQSKRDANYGSKALKQSVNPQTERNIYITLIRHLQKHDKLPVICFTLSRKRCDSNSRMLMDIETIALTNAEEKGKIHRFIRKHTRSLKDIDRKVPQVLDVTKMLENGYGVHHSGILPILKEITEILFSEGLVKVLFATETFAMGINMPARSVVFDSIRKNDGTNFRDLIPSEYIQMAGRAGRRGKDSTGTVIVLVKNEVPDMSTLQQMMMGKAAKLESQFRLTYSMVLNLLKARETLAIESILRRSFVEHKNVQQMSDRNKKQNLIETKLNAFSALECEICSHDIDTFCMLFDDYQIVLREMMPEICKRAMENKTLATGRILVVSGVTNPFQIAVYLRSINPKSTLLEFYVLALTGIDDQWEFRKITPQNVHRILKTKIASDMDTVKIVRENESKGSDDFTETLKCFERLKGLNLESSIKLMNCDHIDPVKDLNMRALETVDKLDLLRSKTKALASFKCLNCDKFLDHYPAVQEKASLKKELKSIQYLSSADNLQFLPEYNSRVEVLKQMKYLNDELCLELKGRVACLMPDHELVITEMLLDNLLGDLAPEDIAALLSAFVFQQKTDDAPIVPEVLEKKIAHVKDIAESIGLLQIECGINYEPVKDFVDSLKFGLVQVVHEWAKGVPFARLMEITDVQEGIIVRCIQRLDELLNDVSSAAKMIGDLGLAERVEKASQCVRRDIVFAASLYLQNDENQVNDDDDEDDDNYN